MLSLKPGSEKLMVPLSGRQAQSKGNAWPPAEALRTEAEGCGAKRARDALQPGGSLVWQVVS